MCLGAFRSVLMAYQAWQTEGDPSSTREVVVGDPHPRLSFDLHMHTIDHPLCAHNICIENEREKERKVCVGQIALSSHKT